MSAKRALIVDDSRSARSFLARILEKYEIEVDTAETAELAIEYLSKSRPDVIFMDHMMPGMDGFQAVQSIKNNPTTAMIPIMMYTSQEGELYLGQARALGAVGVLPKQIKPTEVSTVLHQLHLVPDRRQGRQSAFTPVNEAAVEATRKAAPTLLPVESAVADAAESPPAANSGTASDLAAIADLRQQLESFVRAELGDFRRSISASLDLQSERLLGDVRAAVTDLVPQQPSPPPLPEPVPPSRAPWWVAAAASIAAAAFAVLWWREAAQTQVLAARLVEGNVSATQQAADRNAAAARSAAASASAGERQAETAGSAAAAAGVESATPGQPAAAGLMAVSAQTTASRRTDSQILQLVPYGEVPLSGERLEALRALLNSLVAQNFRGTVTVTSVPGRFCLAGSPSDGYAPAADATPVAGCELVGNPFDEALTMSQREPLALVNLIGAIRKQSAGGFEVKLVTGTESTRAAAYPSATATATAGDWNRAALGNNRVEVRVRPEA
jgi:CheY-like chemotaxis protein